MTAPDGNLPAAIDKLHQAVAALADPIKGWIAGAVMQAPSLYEQLADNVVPQVGERISRSVGKSRPPLFVDALELRSTIDAEVKQWCPAGTSTLDRLHRLASARWRPQDAERLERHANDLQRWAAAIDALLNPEHVKSVSAPCPACGATHVHRTNTSGERVRQAALQLITETGCRCQACGAHWPPERYLLLAAVLGINAPEGVVA